MEKQDIEGLVNTMKQYHPYDDTLDSESCSDEDYVRGYEDGYSRGWTTMLFALKTELRDGKYVVKQKRSKK